MPGDPVYGFPTLNDTSGDPLYPSPMSRNLLGLAAKGNIVIGDYTLDAFRDEIVPLLTAGARDGDGHLVSKTQSYVIDRSDEDIGYHSGIDAYGQLFFDGHYERADGGYRLNPDGTVALDVDHNPIPRKFYESSLIDSVFHSLVDSNLMDGSQAARIDAVLFTNHAFAGLVNASPLMFNGSIVARDDGLRFSRTLRIAHDIRLFDPASRIIALPFDIQRPTLTKWEDCLQGPCP